MSAQKMDMAKVLAMLSQPKEEPAPLTNVEKRIIGVPFLNQKGEKEVWDIWVFIPEGADRPMPVIYVPHYEIGEDSVELRDYLAEGWAVASCHPADPARNGKLADDDLVFNNAALRVVRHLPEVDPDRVALVGGSAGGYCTAMLTGLQLGLCTSVANGPIANAWFDVEYYFEKADELNRQAAFSAAAASNPDERSVEEEEPAPGAHPLVKRLRSLFTLPIPFIAALKGGLARSATISRKGIMPSGKRFPPWVWQRIIPVR